MNPRCPTVTLDGRREGTLVKLTQTLGPRDAARAVGIYDVRTLQSAAFEHRVATNRRIIRGSLDRI
jgi:hypothetical protein